MVSQDLGSAIDNYVEVFRCEPKEQAKSQLRQMIQERVGTDAKPLPSSTEDYELHIQALTKGNEQLKARAEDAEAQNEELKKWNEKLKERVQKADKDLADERTQREMHEGNMGVVIEKLGKKTGQHNFLQRIDELIEKEKAILKPKNKKKEK